MVFLAQSVIFCMLFTIAIVKGMKDPIKGIMSYPPAIRKRIESLPEYQEIIHKEEKLHIGKKLFSIPIIAALLAGACWWGGTRSFLEDFSYGLGLFLIVNLWDLIVLDWLWFCRSPKVRLAGTQDMEKEYKNPWFHLRGFFLGIGIGVIVSLCSCGLLAIFRSLIIK